MNLPKPKRKSNQNILKEISACWILGTALGVAPFFWNREMQESCFVFKILTKEYIIIRFIIIIMIPSIIFVSVYISIYRIISSEVKFVDKIVVLKLTSFKFKTHFKQMKKDLDQNKSSKAGKDKKPQKSRTKVNIYIIVLIFVICWSPLHIVYVTKIFCNDCINQYVLISAICMAHLNSALNPVLYAFHMRDIRNAIFRLFGRSDLVADSSSEQTLHYALSKFYIDRAKLYSNQQ